MARGATAIARLARNGLRFDLQTPWWHLREAARLARDFPDTPIVLNHTGLPADRSAEGIAGWKRAMAQLAPCPNVRREDLRHRPGRRAVDGGGQPRHRADDDRAVRRGALHVREQLPGRQPVRAVRHHLRGLRRDRARLLGRRSDARCSATTRSRDLPDAHDDEQTAHRLRGRRPDGAADDASGCARSAMRCARSTSCRRSSTSRAEAGAAVARLAGRCGARRRPRAAQPADDGRGGGGGVRRRRRRRSACSRRSC